MHENSLNIYHDTLSTLNCKILNLTVNAKFFTPRQCHRETHALGSQATLHSTVFHLLLHFLDSEGWRDSEGGGYFSQNVSEDYLKCLFIMASSEAGKMNEILYNHNSATLPAQEFPALPCEKMVFFFHIIIFLLIKHVGPRWLDIGLVLFLQV